MAPGAVDIALASGSNVTLEVESTPSIETTVSNVEEQQYLDLIRDIIDNGEHRPDRTGTGTYSLFAPTAMRFSLSRPSTSASEPPTPILPLLTTKRVFLRAVIAELLWFLSGSTSSLPLSAAGVHIWDGNASRAYLDSIGLTSRVEGDLGPVYGFQWRHFGAEYVNAATDYTGKGVDQLAEVVKKLKETPWDRRIILSAWNPKDMGLMALPPCHMFAQFYVSFPSRRRGRGRLRRDENSTGTSGANVHSESVSETLYSSREAPIAPSTSSTEAPPHPPSTTHEETSPKTTHPQDPLRTPREAPEKGTLHTHLYQRSCDMGLGIPFNIASYALLTHLLAHTCDLHAGTLTHSMGDAHVYLDHVDALEEQLTRTPRAFPELELKGTGKGVGTVEGMEGWKVEDFVVRGYRPHGKVAMKMSV